MLNQCKNLCQKIKVKTNTYALGKYYCRCCEIFTNYDSRNCPCCGNNFRKKPRNNKYRRQQVERLAKPI